jgi:hypothetical protein
MRRVDWRAIFKTWVSLKTSIEANVIPAIVPESHSDYTEADTGTFRFLSEPV